MEGGLNGKDEKMAWSSLIGKYLRGRRTLFIEVVMAVKIRGCTSWYGDWVSE